MYEPDAAGVPPAMVRVPPIAIVSAAALVVVASVPGDVTAGIAPAVTTESVYVNEPSVRVESTKFDEITALICTVVAVGVVTVTVPDVAGGTVLIQSVAASDCPPHVGTGGEPVSAGAIGIVSESVPPTLIAHVPKSSAVPADVDSADAVANVPVIDDVTCASAGAPTKSVRATALVTANFFIVEKFMIGFSFGCLMPHIRRVESFS